MPIFIGFLSELAYKAVFRWRCVSVKLGFVRKVAERRSGKAKTGEEAEFTGCK
ncbi:hypothetical protein J3P88_24350 [Pseudomonas sp. Z3-6]|uniref:hypothetical protein n=1 Tax=Pseudomonas sp. Z3-6 TaxID=2817411 RepID=UPI000ACCE437